MSNRYRLIILGAGFSRPAGFPLAADLWEEIRETAASFSRDLRAYKFNEDLHRYIEFRREIDGNAPTPDTVDFEDFMGFLDVEHHLGLRGSDTWSEDGNEGTIVTKFLIGTILARHLNELNALPGLYIEFAKRLDLNDTVITFNYDTLLERALDTIGKPYRLFSTRLASVHELRGTVDNSRDEVVVLKVHGSIDWFDRSQFERLIALHERENAPPPEDIIFSHEAALGLERLVDGPCHHIDPLRNVYRAKNLKALYAKRLLFLATPRILPPSATKLLYATRMNDFWYGMGNAGYYSSGMAIIGFSLPTQDDYARQILYALVTNYQKHNWGKGDPHPKKTPLAIVDFFSDAASEARFRERYRFVDWSRADLSGRGFDFASLDKIFA
ncbi:MAG TPA: SIR2 family protein [Amaricoccus sp.]|uniref:SIR2 family protein n=1 Tax=Amaricoccus sp. TaxID=1872485 RepID=UPI002BEFC242|nr:SIR2 family protein [Amaricoccus sp.]HMQ91552.1 SIR2 family protein [Amaricoccus sp.]HMR50971.1 SIR2 family protein [Amaricoccus sp.]HMR59837.1 SIR2 family protein [Amaricoccus sp.]HMT97850.1 SIR2 family protein [Amaricoccus sp.]